MFDIKAVEQLGASGLDNAKITAESIDKIVEFYKHVDKLDINHKKLLAKVRTNAYSALK